MHKKVMLELPNGSRRWGCATTEHSAVSYNKAVVILDNIPYSSKDIRDKNICIITNDKEAVLKLKDAGFTPISRTRVKKSKGITFTKELEEKIEFEAKIKELNFSQTVISILNDYFKIPK